MTVNEDQTFSSAEVCLAAGLLRSTFDTWLLRHYLPLPLGPGTGRVRTYSFRDAVRIAVAAELTRLGIPAGVAGRVVTGVEPDVADEEARRKPGDADEEAQYQALVLAASAVAPRVDGPKGPATSISRIQSSAQLKRLLRSMVTAGPPAGHVVVDITAITERTRAILDDPAQAADRFPQLRDPVANMLKGGAGNG